MVGFMLAHEQFQVPDLIDIGVAAENAGKPGKPGCAPGQVAKRQILVHPLPPR